MNRFRLALLLLLIFKAARADDILELSVGQRQLFLDDEGIAKIDGIHRTMHQPKKRGAVIVPDQSWETALQTRCAPVWDQTANRYKLWLITSTPVDGVAGTTYAESQDGVTWTKPILRQWDFQGSSENNFIAVEPELSWPANAMENVVYDPDDNDPQRRFKGFLSAHGRQPIISLDGIHWTKLDVPMLPSSDESNLTQILPPSAPVVRGDELWFYYTGLKYRAEPAEPVVGGSGAICLAVLRRDGFVSLDAEVMRGTITTKPFKWAGSKLIVNVETKEQGELRAEVLDYAGTVIATSQPVTGNQPHGEFRWSQVLPESLQGQQVSLRFMMREARFYAWWLE